MIDNAAILPSAMWLRLTGVISNDAIVPRSFSPAMDSGATEIHPLYKKINNQNGSIEEKSCAVESLSSAISKVSALESARFTSNLLAMADSF